MIRKRSLSNKERNGRKWVGGGTHEPFTVALKALLVENLNGNGKGFEANSDVLINVALVNGTKAALAENVVRAEALGDGLQLE